MTLSKHAQRELDFADAIPPPKTSHGSAEVLSLDTWNPGQRPPRARSTDPGSSHAAATDMERSGKMGAQMAEALRLVRAYPGLTSKQLAEVSELDRYQIARRLPDLEKKGLARHVDRGRGEQVRWFPTKEKA